MKILLSWVLDYIDCKIADIDVDHLVYLFNTRTAEIESYERITLPLKNFFIVRITSASHDSIAAHCAELNKDLTLTSRTDVVVGKHYLIMQDGTAWRWVSMKDLHSQKDGLFPAVLMTEDQRSGAWRTQLPAVDYVLDVDNKSINHRPDLWGHYGIAREIAAFLNKKLKSLDMGLQQIHQEHDAQLCKDDGAAFELSIEKSAQPHCFRVAALACQVKPGQDSALGMALRLTLVDGKPMNAMVDITNYVMFDIGHPMHVFNRKAFVRNKMIVRMAQQGEKLELLDGQNVSLQSSDVIISDGQQPVSLVGVMGGKNSGYHVDENRVILEAAGLAPATIRKTAQRCKVRTEACMRFEKFLDPMQNTVALQRFVFLAKKLNILEKVEGSMLSVGQKFESKVIKMAHRFVETQLGVTLDVAVITDLLTKLGFQVQYFKEEQVYHVTVPTLRQTKDIKIPQDLVEEIVRTYGFENITPQLPMRPAQPFSFKAVRTTDRMKQYFAYGMNMHEVRDYLFYDASFIQNLSIDLSQAIVVKSSVSQNWTTLVTSLIPHMLKNVAINIVGRDHLRFFECNRVWNRNKDASINERFMTSGIVFDKKSVDFYQVKAQLQALFDQLRLNVSWQKPVNVAIPAWFDAHQCAQLILDEKYHLGFVGMMSAVWMQPVIEGSACIFELDATMLLETAPAPMKFKAWSAFQEVVHDISLLVPLNVIADDVKTSIAQANACIQHVEIVDFFEKEEWQNHRSVTLRYTMSDATKTMTKQEIDQVVNQVQKAVEKHGAQIR